MGNEIKGLLSSQKILPQALRYLMTGGLVYVLDLVVFSVCVYIFSMDPLASNLLAKAIGAISGFFLHRDFTFAKDAKVSNSSAAFRYVALWLFNVLAANSFFYFLMIELGVLPFWGKIISDVFIILLSFLVSRYFIFSGHR